MIDVEQRALRALQQHRCATNYCAVNPQPDILGEWQQSLGELLQHVEGVIHVGPFRPGYGRQLNVRVCDAALHEPSQPLGVAQVEHADPTPAELVLIRWSDSPSGRSDLFAGRALTVYQLVIRKHEMGAVAHIQPTFDVDAIGNQLVDLGEQRLDVEHNTVADRAPNTGMKNPARDLVQHERLVADVNCVPRIGPALISNDPVRALRKNIDQLALALVSPLGADDDDGARVCIEHGVGEAGGGGKKKQTPRGLRGVGSIYLSEGWCQRCAGGGGGTSSMTRGGSSGR